MHINEIEGFVERSNKGQDLFFQTSHLYPIRLSWLEQGYYKQSFLTRVNSIITGDFFSKSGL